MKEDLYKNDFHRKNSEAAQREAQEMMQHTYTREQKIKQIQSLKHSHLNCNKEI